ncbi:MAG: insulinase family protein [candidate division NC10 bacterium]|nr:insulinase family protein [candidate division NC10 bacterium]
MGRKAFRAIACLLPLLLFSFASAWAGEVFEATLKNGLKVLLKEDHRAPIATFQVWYKVGSKNEGPGITGASHLLEHMMFKGTERYSPMQFARIVQKNGGWSNAFTGKDYTAYYENIAADRLELVLELEADRMQNLLLDPQEFKAEREVVKEERRLRIEDDPTSLLREELLASAFKAHPYRQPVIGWMSDLERITREDLYRYYKTYYVPNNASIVAVGDFDKFEILKKIEKHFGPIPPGSNPPRPRTVEPEQNGERRLLLRKEAELPFLYIGYHTPSLTHPDRFALEVLSAILSEGKSSRLYKGLVYDKQIALYAGADYSWIHTDPNLFYFYASVLPGRTAEEVEKAIYAEIERLKGEPVSDRELQKAKNQIEAFFILSQDSIFFQGEILGMHESVADWRLWEAYLPGIRAVTVEDVQKVAKKYYSEDNRTVAILAPIKGSSQ